MVLVLTASSVLGGITISVARSGSPFIVLSVSSGVWTNVSPSAGPAARWLHAMAYDSNADRIILFGGCVQEVVNRETWAYDLNKNAWTNMSPSAGPSARDGHAMAYDSMADRVILFGDAETWAYDFNANTWTNLTSIISPALFWPRMAYDSQSDRIVLFGGLGESAETWAYDFESNTWINMRPSVSPPALGTIVYDSQSDRVIGVELGSLAPGTAPTWAYDYNTNVWASMNTTVHLSAREYHTMAYDSMADRVILFGGYPPQGVVNRETWAYDFNANAWTNLTSIISPPAPFWPAMAYDSESDRVVLFGGASDEGSPRPARASEETWSYDFGAQAGPTITPVWVVYATVAGAGAAIAAVVSVLLWRRHSRSRAPPPPPPSS